MFSENSTRINSRVYFKRLIVAKPSACLSYYRWSTCYQSHIKQLAIRDYPQDLPIFGAVTPRTKREHITVFTNFPMKCSFSTTFFYQTFGPYRSIIKFISLTEHKRGGINWNIKTGRSSDSISILKHGIYWHNLGGLEKTSKLLTFIVRTCEGISAMPTTHSWLEFASSLIAERTPARIVFRERSIQTRKTTPIEPARRSQYFVISIASIDANFLFSSWSTAVLGFSIKSIKGRLLHRTRVNGSRREDLWDVRFDGRCSVKQHAFYDS